MDTTSKHGESATVGRSTIEARSNQACNVVINVSCDGRGCVIGPELVMATAKANLVGILSNDNIDHMLNFLDWQDATSNVRSTDRRFRHSVEQRMCTFWIAPSHQAAADPNRFNTLEEALSAFLKLRREDASSTVIIRLRNPSQRSILFNCNISGQSFSSRLDLNPEKNWMGLRIATPEMVAVYENGSQYSVVVKNGTTAIRAQEFHGCTGLTSVVFPEGFESIYARAFNGCINLTSIIFSGGLKVIGNFAFAGCTKLVSVVLPAGLTSIGNFAFFGCTGLVSVTLPEGLISIGNFAFAECAELASVQTHDHAI